MKTFCISYKKKSKCDQCKEDTNTTPQVWSQHDMREYLIGHNLDCWFCWWHVYSLGEGCVCRMPKWNLWMCCMCWRDPCPYAFISTRNHKRLRESGKHPFMERQWHHSLCVHDRQVQSILRYSNKAFRLSWYWGIIINFYVPPTTH